MGSAAVEYRNFCFIAKRVPCLPACVRAWCHCGCPNYTARMSLYRPWVPWAPPQGQCTTEGTPHLALVSITAGANLLPTPTQLSL